MNPEDKTLFEKAMIGVKPLKRGTKVTHKKEKPPATRQKTAAKKVEHNHMLTAPREHHLVYAEDTLSYGKDRVQAKQFKNLKQGKLIIEATLDLHHHTISQAESKLPEFIQHAYLEQKRVVLIIHGKGGYQSAPSKMKSHVYHWLQLLPEVLAFHSACPKDGGQGAVYVLLKSA